MNLNDVFVRFDIFLESVLKIEQLPEFTPNMFAIEQTSPKDFMIMRYPYTTKSSSTIELLARLGVMTATCMSMDVYNILVSNESIRLIIVNDGLQFFPFNDDDKLSICVMPSDNVIKYTPYVLSKNKITENLSWTTEYPRVVYCEAVSSNSAIGTRLIEVATIPGDIADDYQKEIIRQINDKSIKVVAVPNR